MATHVMPIKILIEKSNIMLENIRYYTRDGQPLYSMTDIPSIAEAQTEEMDDELFCELMSIRDKADAKLFSAKHPCLRFAYHSHPAFFVKEMETEEQYYEEIVQSTNQFNDLRLFLALQRTYIHKNAACKANTNCPEWNALREIYSKHFHQLHQHESHRVLSDMEQYYFDLNNRVDAVTEQYIDNNPYGASYQDLMDDYFEGNDTRLKMHYEEVQKQVDETIDHWMFTYISAFVSKITSRANITFDAESSSLVYKCPDLLTAMYMMIFVSMFNEDEYRQCTHPKCHAYFKLDKSHPQKMCDIHMASRRNKRKNARDKRKTDYSKCPYPTDFEE